MGPGLEGGVSAAEGRGMMEKEPVVGGPWHRDRGTGQGRAICMACMGFALAVPSWRVITDSSMFTGIIRSPFFSGAHRGDEHASWLTLLTTRLGPVSVEVRVSVRAWIRTGPGTGPPAQPNQHLQKSTQLNSRRRRARELPSTKVSAEVEKGGRGRSGMCAADSVEPEPAPVRPYFLSLRSDTSALSPLPLASYLSRRYS